MERNSLFTIFILFSPGILGIRPITGPEKLMLVGKYLRLGVVETPPYAAIIHDSNETSIQVDGYVDYIMNFLADKYQFTFDYAEPSDGGYIGSCINDSCNGLVGMLVRGEIDVIASGIVITRTRSLHIDFTYEIQIDALSLLITRPHQEATIGRITLPFQYEVSLHIVWILILTSIAVVACALFLIFRFESYWMAMMNCSEEELGFIPQWTLGDYVIFLLPILVNSGNQLPSKNGVAFRILLAAWCLGAVVITNSYNTSIKSFLMLPRYRATVNTLEELIENPDYLFVVQKFNSIWGDIMISTSGPYFELRKSLRQHPENALLSLENVNDMILHQKKILGQLKSQNLYRLTEDYKATGDCRLYLGDDFGETHVSLAVKKGSNSFSNMLSYELLSLRESGLLAYWTASTWPKPNRCSVPIETQQSGVNEKLSLNYLFGAFTLLGAGLMASIVAFVMELLVHHVKNPNQLNLQVSLQT